MAAAAAGGTTSTETQMAQMKAMAESQAKMTMAAAEAKKITSEADLLAGVQDSIANSKSKIGQKFARG